MLAGSAMAYDFSAVSPTGQTLYYNVNSDSVSVTVTYPASTWSGYQEPKGRLVVPSTVSYNGHQYVVTAIGQSAFAYCTSMLEVELPATLQRIDTNAFDLTFMDRLEVPDNVTYINSKAFPTCKVIYYHGSAAGAPWGGYECEPVLRGKAVL